MEKPPFVAHPPVVGDSGGCAGDVPRSLTWVASIRTVMRALMTMTVVVIFVVLRLLFLPLLIIGPPAQDCVHRTCIALTFGCSAA